MSGKYEGEGQVGALALYLAVLWLVTAPLWIAFPPLIPGLLVASLMALAGMGG